MSFWYKIVLYKKLGQSFKSPLNKETEVCSVLSLPCLPLELQYNQTAQAGKRKGERGWKKEETRENKDRNKSILFATHHLLPALQDLSDNLGSFLVGGKQLLALFALALDGVIFVKEFAKQFFFVQLADQSVLDNVLGVVDQKMHDCFGDLVGNRLPYNVEV